MLFDLGRREGLIDDFEESGKRSGIACATVGCVIPGGVTTPSDSSEGERSLTRDGREGRSKREEGASSGSISQASYARG